MQEDTIAGIASGMGGGIGIIRVSGSDALSIVGKVFCTRRDFEIMSHDAGFVLDDAKRQHFFDEKDSHTIHYGYITDGCDIIDEVIVLLMKAPNSYTREDVVEIDSHGGAYILKKILHLLVKKGARLARAGEFTQRAFLNGRIDLSQAEAVMKMVSSENDFSLKSAMSQLKGSVSKYIEQIRQEMLHDIGQIEAALDDPEHMSLDGFADTLRSHLTDWIHQMNTLLDHFEDGRLKSEGIGTVIVGKPNAGKSSLMNLLLDQERAIVTEIAGTTRDTLEERVYIGNLILNLTDTAGIRDTKSVIESLGVKKAKQSLDHADFIIYVVDAGMEMTEEDDQIMALLQRKKGVILLNKSDQKTVILKEDIQKKLDWHVILFSNQTKEGFEELKQYITDTFDGGGIAYNDQIYLTSVRHKEAVEEAVESLHQVIQAIDDGIPEDFFTIDMMDAYQKLGLIHGDTASEDLIQKIFSDFCMGK